MKNNQTESTAEVGEMLLAAKSVMNHYMFVIASPGASDCIRSDFLALAEALKKVSTPPIHSTAEPVDEMGEFEKWLDSDANAVMFPRSKYYTEREIRLASLAWQARARLNQAGEA